MGPRSSGRGVILESWKSGPARKKASRMAVVNSSGHGPGRRNCSCHLPGMSASSSASRPRVDSVWSALVDGDCRTSANHSVTRWSISSAASWVAERSGSAGARRMARSSTRRTSWPSSSLVADAQGVKIIFHLHVGGVPIFQRASGEPSGGVGQNVRRVHGGLKGNIEHRTSSAQHPNEIALNGTSIGCSMLNVEC